MKNNYLVFILLDYHTLLYAFLLNNTEQVIDILKKYHQYESKVINLRMNKNKLIYNFVKE